MSKVSDLIIRLQSFGASVALDGNGLRVINGSRLPKEAVDFIARHRAALIDHLRDQQAAAEERAAIIEYDGGVPRPVADQLARLLTANRPADVGPEDWIWFVGKAAEVIDRSAA